MKSFTRAAFVLLMMGILGVPLQAQEARNGTDIQAELREMAASPSEADRDRAVVNDFLGQDRVQEVAAGIDVDTDRLQAEVNTLDDGEVAGLADRVRDAQQDSPLAGGDRIVITTTTVIIALLVIILLIVA